MSSRFLISQLKCRQTACHYDKPEQSLSEALVTISQTIARNEENFGTKVFEDNHLEDEHLKELRVNSKY